MLYVYGIDELEFLVFIHFHQPGAPTVHEGIKHHPAQGVDKSGSSQSKRDPQPVKPTAVTEDANSL